MTARRLYRPLLLIIVAAAAGAALQARYNVQALVVSAITTLSASEAGSGGDGEAKTAVSAPRAVPVEAVEVRVDRVTEEITAVGTLRSNESVVVRPELSGRIQTIHFEEGSTVSKGAPLVSLDGSLYQAELAEARARVELSKRNYERALELYGKRATSASARDEALARLEIDKASLELARVRMEKTRIHAPFPGILGLRHVSTGSYVNVGQDLVNLESIDPIKVDFRIPERYLGALASGQSLRIRVDAFPDTEFRGAVYALDPLVDPQGRSVALRARIPNSGGKLRPGLFARVRLIVEERPEALLVPEQAVVPRADASYVYRIVDGKAVFTRVNVGKRRLGEVEIVSGLSRGDVVVTAGQLKLRDDAPVVRTDATEASG